jgi:hypothetical protein
LLSGQEGRRNCRVFPSHTFPTRTLRLPHGVKAELVRQPPLLSPKLGTPLELQKVTNGRTGTERWLPGMRANFATSSVQ